MTVWNDAVSVRVGGGTADAVAVRVGGTGEQVWPQGSDFYEWVAQGGNGASSGAGYCRWRTGGGMTIGKVDVHGKDSVVWWDGQIAADSGVIYTNLANGEKITYPGNSGENTGEETEDSRWLTGAAGGYGDGYPVGWVDGNLLRIEHMPITGDPWGDFLAAQPPEGWPRIYRGEASSISGGGVGSWQSKYRVSNTFPREAAGGGWYQPAMTGAEYMARLMGWTLTITDDSEGLEPLVTTVTDIGEVGHPWVGPLAPNNADWIAKHAASGPFPIHVHWTPPATQTAYGAACMDLGAIFLQEDAVADIAGGVPLDHLTPAMALDGVELCRGDVARTASTIPWDGADLAEGFTVVLLGARGPWSSSPIEGEQTPDLLVNWAHGAAVENVMWHRTGTDGTYNTVFSSFTVDGPGAPGSVKDKVGATTLGEIVPFMDVFRLYPLSSTDPTYGGIGQAADWTWKTDAQYPGVGVDPGNIYEDPLDPSTPAKVTWWNDTPAAGQSETTPIGGVALFPRTLTDAECYALLQSLPSLTGGTLTGEWVNAGEKALSTLAPGEWAVGSNPVLGISWFDADGNDVRTQNPVPGRDLLEGFGIPAFTPDSAVVDVDDERFNYALTDQQHADILAAQPPTLGARHALTMTTEPSDTAPAAEIQPWAPDG